MKEKLGNFSYVSILEKSTILGRFKKLMETEITFN